MADPVNARLVLSASLENFIKFFHWYLYRDEFIVMDFHREIIRKIEDIAFGRNKKKNLAINISPRVGKSSIVKYACAWSYMINPKSNNLYTSYSDDLANDFSKDIREIVESEPFVRFTGLSFKKGKTGADYWVTSAGGGFRAAPLGGGLTGYGCFSYGTKVVTDRGNLRIGDIVSHKLDVKFKSLGVNGIEWKKPIRYIKNDDSEFLRIILNDGTIIDCTTDHEFYTKEGILRADELTLDSVFPSDTDNNISSYAKFIKNILVRIVFIADKLSLFFRGKVFINRGLFDFNDKSGCFSSPIDTSFNVGNISERKPIICRNFFIPSSVLSDFASNIRVNFAVSVMRSVANRVLLVLGLSSVSKVFNRIVKRVSVKMTNYLPFRSIANKCFGNKMMNKPMFNANTDKKVSFIGFPRFKDSRLFKPKTSDSAEGRNFVFPLPFFDRKPLFIYKIGHFPSYCVTIPVNHNIFLSERQEVLVKNCGGSGDEFAGFGILDDPNKPSLVKSQTELQNTIDLYLNAFKSRANNRAKTPFILIMQRVAIDDLTGYVLENEAEDWDLIKVPALNEETGESIWEDKLPAEELWKMKKQSPFVYYSQYQQEPIVIGGSVIKTEWFRFYPVSENYDYQYTFVTSDTAMKKGEGNDFTVFSFWGKTFDNKLHLIDMVRGKWDAGELKQQVILTWEKWRGFKCPPYGMYIEDKSSGIGVLQELRQKFPIPLIPVTRARYKNDNGVVIKADKLSRAMTCVPYIANGWVYLPNNEKDDISSLLLSECAAFNMELSQKHDDMCFVAGTPIVTIFGDKPIEKIKAGDYVITPLGIRRVLDSKCTGYKKTINKFGIRATSNHKFFTWKGFKSFKDVNSLSECDVFSLRRLILWRYKKLLSLMVSNIDLWEGRKGIIYLSQQKIQEENILKDFMLQFGNFIQEKKFLKGMLFTTKTTILIIMSFLIWNVYHAGNILRFIKIIFSNGGEVGKERGILMKLGNLLKLGIKQKNQKNLKEKTQKPILIKSEKQKYVPVVEGSSLLVENRKFAEDVEMLLPIEKDGQKEEKVYNLTIDKDNVYYANRILVSNCDTMLDAIDIAFGTNGVSSIFI